MQKCEIFPGFLDAFARDLGVSPLSTLSPKGLKEYRDSVLSGLLTTGSECESTVRDLRYCEFFAKARAVIPGFEPESTIPSFVAQQYRPTPIHADEPELDAFRTVLDRIVGPGVQVKDLVRAMRHGPGTTASGVMSVDKWLALRVEGHDPLIEAADPLQRLVTRSVGTKVSNNFSFTNRYMEVPKTLWKNRGICAEQVWNQFVQQGIGRILARRLRPFTDISKQWNNIVAAQRPGWVTIDLSAASDSISVELFEWYDPNFGGATFGPEDVVKIQTLMDHYRSHWCAVPRSIDDEEGLIELSSFATMGNGFCFPLLTAVCIAIATIAAGRASGITPRGVARLPQGQLRKLFTENASVYGDDIVVSPSTYPYLLYYLAIFGFEVNAAKSSAINSRLKETCGAFILDGHVHTDMLRLRDCTTETISSITGLVDLQRRAYERGLRRTAGFAAEVVQTFANQGLYDFHDPESCLTDRTAFDSTLVLFSNTRVTTRPRMVLEKKGKRPNYQKTMVEVWKQDWPTRTLALGDGVAWAQSLWSDHCSAVTAEPLSFRKDVVLRRVSIPTHW